MRAHPDDRQAIRLTPPSAEGASAGQDLLSAKIRPHTLDDTDSALMALLLENGRMTNRELSSATGIGEATAGARLRRLVTDRVLIFTTLFDWEAAGYEWFVIAKINVEARLPKNVAEDIARLPECEATAVVFGDVDVLAYFLVTDRSELNRLVENRLAAISGITGVAVDLATRSAVTPLGRRFYLARQAPPIRLPNPVIPVDGTDARIMQALIDDGRQSNRRIARRLEVSEGTVRARLNRLTEAGLMRVAAMVEPLALGMIGVVANVGLRVNRDAISSVADALETLPQTLFSAVTVGSADVNVAIAGTDQNDLLDTVLRQIRSLPGVRSTETLQMIDIVRFAASMKRLT